MIIDFTIENYRSFRDRTTLSLIATPEVKIDPESELANVISVNERLSLLRAVGIYGANASGKSNIGKALHDFRTIILESADSDFELDLNPFFFRTANNKKPITLEMQFILASIPYRYGFSVLDGKFVGEWLYVSRSAWETKLFERKNDIVERGRAFREGTAFLEEGILTNPTSLFLTQCSKSKGGEISKALLHFIQKNIQIISGLQEAGLRRYTIDCLEKERYLSGIQTIVKKADTGILDFRLAEESEVKSKLVTPEDMPIKLKEVIEKEIIKDLRLTSKHVVYNDNNEPDSEKETPFSLTESQGTQKLFAFAGPILDTLHKGNTLFIDEIDAKLHPILTRAIISLFQSEETNPNNAQLIFITHDTNLLHSNKFRRDQIWFTEKDNYGASHLYSLAEFKLSKRKNTDLEQDYIDGRFGAIPFMGDWSHLLREIPTNVEDSH
jgi:uncharacterized protein